MNYCVNCGEKLANGASFCVKCGHRVNGNGTTTNVQPTQTSLLTCPKCRSNNINVQMINETQLVKQKRGCVYWVLIGWWLELFLWICLTLPRLLIAIFMPKRQKVVNKQKKVMICQNCGHSWN